MSTDFNLEPKKGLKIFDTTITKVISFKKRKPSNIFEDSFA